MGTPIEDGNVQGDPGEGGTPGQNPAWNDVLSVIPEQYHQQVTPYFQKWDQSAQTRIEEVNGRLKSFEPYQQFVEHGIDPGELEQGLRLMYEINNNPRAVYDALAEAYNLTPQQVQDLANGNKEEEEENPYLQDPRIDQLQQGLDLVGQVVLQDQQRRMAEQADAELDAELKSLESKYGNFDERYVLALMANGASGDDAVKAFQELTNTVIQNNPRPFAPNVMGGSGGSSGLPSQAIDPTKLSGQETRALVAQMLNAARRQS